MANTKIKNTSGRQKKMQLYIVCFVSIPLIFLSCLYLFMTLKDGSWSFQFFLGHFEGHALILVIAVFMFLGLMMGFGVWHQVNLSFEVFQNAKKLL